MAESTAPDPVELWRDLLTQWERSVNDMSNKVMTSDEFSSSANQVTAVLLKVQQSLGDLLDKYFRALNLPTRKDVERLDDRMMAIEDLLHSMGGLLERLANSRGSRSDEIVEDGGEPVASHAHTESLHTHSESSHFAHADSSANGHVSATGVSQVVAPENDPVKVAKKTKRSAPAVVAVPAKAVKRPPRTKKPPAKKSSAT